MSSPFKSPLDTYVDEVTQIASLTLQQEDNLCRRLAKGDSEARDHMLRASLRLVVDLACKHRSKGLSMQDLIDEGNQGLIQAIEEFDYGKNGLFSNYAVGRIEQCILRAIARNRKDMP